MAFDLSYSTLRPSKRGFVRGLGLMLGLLVLGGCKAGQRQQPVAEARDTAGASARQEESRMWMTIGERRFAITLADTDAARAFVAQLPLTLDMAELTATKSTPTCRRRCPPMHTGRERSTAVI